MRLLTLIVKNIWSKKSRSIGIAGAVAIAVMAVVTLSVVSSGLETSAAAVLTLGHADFTVAQKGVSEILYSSIDQGELRAIETTPGVQNAVGVLLEIENIAGNPVFIEIGIPPDELHAFGVTVVAGQPYTATASHEVMLGWRASQNLGLHVGDRFNANGTWNTVVGIYSTGISYGDSGAMFPLIALQAYNRVPGEVTLVFCKVKPGVSITSVQNAIERNHPELVTIRTAAQFGRADRDLIYLQASVTGSTILAIVIGAIIVANTMLLSLFERTREFGLLRAIGWTRHRLITMVVGETLLLAVLGSLLGVGLSFLVTFALEHLQLRGTLHSNYTYYAFWRALYTGLGMAVLGSLYPALRAAELSPLDALSHE